MKQTYRFFSREVHVPAYSATLEFIFGLAFLSIGLLSFLAWWGTRLMRMPENLYETQALVLKDSLSQGSEPKTYYLLQFDYDGKTHQFYDNDGQTGVYRYKLGDSAKVFFYKSEGPSFVRIDNFVSRTVYPTIFLIIAILFLSTGLLFCLGAVFRWWQGKGSGA